MPNSDIETEAPHSPWQRLRRLLRLAIPSAGEMLLGMLVGLVNTYLIGHLGAASLTGVGLGVQWTMASMVLFSAVSTGATALTARMIGAQDTLGASRVVGQALAIAFGAMLAGQEACVYLQNSGLGNMINPITSLCLPAQVYPFLIIGHRHTLAQHKVMGEIDRDLMALTNYPEDRYVIVSGSNNEK